MLTSQCSLTALWRVNSLIVLHIADYINRNTATDSAQKGAATPLIIRDESGSFIGKEEYCCDTENTVSDVCANIRFS